MKALLMFVTIVAGVQAAKAPEAVLAAVVGPATVDAGKVRAPAHTFDWLASGAVLETGEGARVLLVLADGSRYQIGERARVVLKDHKLKVLVGQAVPLNRLSELPKLAPIADRSVGSQTAAVRIRGEKLRSCYPFGGATVLASNATLLFEPIDSIPSYLVRVEDSAGRSLYSKTHDTAIVPLAAGLLHPGQKYYWEVRGIRAAGDGPRCDAEFATLTPDQERSRTALQTAVDRAHDPDAVAVLAEADRHLGLIREAYLELMAALPGSTVPDDIRVALSKLQPLLPRP